MAIGEVVIDGDKRLVAQIGEIPARARQALIDGLTPVAASMLADAKSRGAAHIRYLGMNPGVYVDSMLGGVSTKSPKRVLGYLSSNKPTINIKGRDVPLAAVLEHGGHTKAHEILPSVAKALHFTGSAGEVFAKAVRHPGATMPAYPAVYPAFAAARGQIMEVFASVKIKSGIDR